MVSDFSDLFGFGFGLNTGVSPGNSGFAFNRRYKPTVHEAGACRDEVSDDDILLETLKEVDLPEDGSLIEDLGGLLE